MSANELLDKALQILRQTAQNAAPADRDVILSQAQKLDHQKAALGSALEGREAREQGKKQLILQNNSRAVDILNQFGPTLASQENRPKAAEFAQTLQAIPPETIDKLADFLAKGLESELTSKSLFLFVGLAKLSTLSSSEKNQLNNIRTQVKQLALDASLPEAKLDEFRELARVIGEIQNFLSLKVSLDTSLILSDANSVSSFSSQWLTDFVTPMTRAILDAGNQNYIDLMDSMAVINAELTKELEDLVALVNTIKVINTFLSFFSKALGLLVP